MQDPPIFLGIWEAIGVARAALVDEPAAATARGLPPLDTAGILWVAAIDRVPISDRIEWVKAIEKRVSEINSARACCDPGSASAAADEPKPLTPDEWTLEHATDWRIPSARAAYNRYLEAFDAAAAADEPGETPA